MKAAHVAPATSAGLAPLVDLYRHPDMKADKVYPVESCLSPRTAASVCEITTHCIVKIASEFEQTVEYRAT
jgi:hypothetical protein